jgi:serine/threonine protein kinase
MTGPEPSGFMVGLSVGSRIAGYRLEEQIGEGGMAVVFRARDERLQRQVALKILSPALAADEEFRRRFIRESRSAAAVDDPHIIPVFEAGDANGVLFIAMRYVPGGDVGTLVRRLGPLPSARAAAIVSAVASALDSAHAAGLVHRDIKPANMLVDSRPGRPDHVYLSDFGLTKGSSSSTSLTSTGHFMGTLDYSAPEQIRGQQVDARTDEYGLACVAFALLSGKPPFHRDEAMAVMYAHLSAPPPMLTSLRPGLPPEVDEIMRRALAKAPEDRYPSCGEFADALRIALGLGRYNSDETNTPYQQALIDHAAPLAPPASLTANPAARRSDEAIEQYQRTLVNQRHTLGPDHPDTLATRFSIAQQLAARGKHARAEEEFRELLPRLRRRLGPDHPDTLATWFSIAQQLAARGNDAGAEKEFRYMLPHLRRKLGPDHPNTLAAIEWIDYIQARKDDRSAAPRPRS